MLTQKQENFCLKYVEFGDASKAYRAVYNVINMKSATANRKAKELMDNGKIRSRIAELRAPAAAAAKVTLEQHLNELQRLRDIAINTNQMSAAITAEISRGKASGLYVEKREVSGPNGGPIETSKTINVKDLTDEELRVIAEAHKRMA